MNPTNHRGISLQDLHDALSAPSSRPTRSVHFGSQTIAEVNPEKLTCTRAKKPASLFKFLQQRRISGYMTGRAIESLCFLSNLARRQLLLSAEFEVLSRAVACGQCVIEPQQCSSGLGIDMLRIVAVFLRMLENSPEIKKNIETFIAKAPTVSGQQYFAERAQTKSGVNDDDSEVVRSPKTAFKDCNIESIKLLTDDLSSVLANHDAFIRAASALPMLGDKEKAQHLKDLIRPHISKMDMHVCAVALIHNLTHLTASAAKLRDELARLIKAFEQAVRFSCEKRARLDRMPINRVLLFNKAFSKTISVISRMRQAPREAFCMDHRLNGSPFASRFLLTSDYVDIVEFRGLDDHIARGRDFTTMSIAKMTTEQVWVNYQGAHLEFELWWRLQSPSVLSTISDLAIPGLSCEAVFGFHSVYYSGGLASCTWVVDLFRGLQQWLSEPVRVDAQSFFLAMWDCDYTALDDFPWLISVIARSGMRPWPMHDRDYSSDIVFMCPCCAFQGKIRNCSTSPRKVRDIGQLHAGFVHMLQQHKKKLTCSIAQSLQLEPLWREHHHGPLPPEE